MDELLNSCKFEELCSLWISLCVHHRQLMCDRSWTGHANETPTYDSRFGLRSLLNHCEGLRSTLPRISTKFDAHSLFLSLIHRENRHRSRRRLQWELPTSTQLRTTWQTDSLDMVLLPCTGTSRYHNRCLDGGTSPECFGYHLVFSEINCHCVLVVLRNVSDCRETLTEIGRCRWSL
jgi:hypothetical protein